ncbi:MAG: hypothetical protein NTW38_06300 [Candidatus Aminicenantes bacterium]|nr:hypothetical protein [Candidatus Aminicenantes bacterium]
MKKSAMALAAAWLFGGLVACVTSHYSSDNMNYYRGENIPPEFFQVVSHTTTEITFEIRVNFVQDRLYHLVLDGNTPLAEDWILMVTGKNQSYAAVLKAKPGIEFVPGKAYRLCIGDKNPEEVNIYSNNYRCLADYDFTLK